MPSPVWVRLTIFLSLGLGSVGSLSGEDWPRWRGPRGDGTWQAPAKIPLKWPEGGPPKIWKMALGPGYSGISVAQGRVYTMDRPWKEQKGEKGEKVADNSERIVAFDAATGVLLWEHRYAADYTGVDYGKGPRCTPTVHDGRVYTLGTVGHLHCLDAASGKVLWSKDLVRAGGAKIPLWGLAASPVIDGKQVIIHAGQSPGGCYAALDRLTGEEIWRSGDDPAGYGTPIIITHAGTRMLVGWTPEHIVAHRLTDGKLLWQVEYKVEYGVSIATPIFHEGLVLVCGYWHGSKAIRLGEKPEDAELAWEENTYLRGLMDQPLYREGQAYLLDKTHGIVAFKLATGEKMWTDNNRLHPRDRNPQVSLVWLGETGRAIALNAHGDLMLVKISPTGLEEQSRAKIVGETWAHPAYAGEHAYARDDEQIVCIKLIAEE